MLVVRGTKKFLDRAGRPDSDPPASNTLLGDWYATVLFWNPQVALFVNERTLVPVLVPFAPALTAAARFGAALQSVLELHAIEPAFVAHELAAMDSVVLAKTANRSVIGMLNQFSYLAQMWRVNHEDLLDLSVRLATVPCGPLYKTHVTPHDALAAAAEEWLGSR